MGGYSDMANKERNKYYQKETRSLLLRENEMKGKVEGRKFYSRTDYLKFFFHF